MERIKVMPEAVGISRRRMLYFVAAAGLTACQTSIAPLHRGSRLVSPVKATIDRIEKQIVGLRPGRKSGFRLDVEAMIGKQVIHNYGHGGDGVTLSWPCAEWAADQASVGSFEPVAILGSGVSGLTTAWVLAKRGIPVSVYARQFPPNTTSNIAGAIILTVPYYRSGLNVSKGPSDKAINRRVLEGFKPFVGHPRYGVYWVDHVQVENAPDSLTGEQERFLGRSIADKFRTIMVDPNYYLAALVQDLKDMNTTFVKREFATKNDLVKLEENVVVNCTGLGAGPIFDDQMMVPIRGQLTLLKAQSEIDYSYICRDPGGVLYMFPRRDHIVLGGTHERGVTSLVPDHEEAVRQVKRHGELMSQLTHYPAMITEIASI